MDGCPRQSIQRLIDKTPLPIPCLFGWWSLFWFVVLVCGLVFLCFLPLFCSNPVCLTCVVNEKLKSKPNQHQNFKKKPPQRAPQHESTGARMQINIKGAGPSALRPAGRGAQGGSSPVLINLVGAPAAGGGKALYFRSCRRRPGWRAGARRDASPVLVDLAGARRRGTGRGPEGPRPCSIRSCRRPGGGTAIRLVLFKKVRDNYIRIKSSTT